jgi:hypothetical protein
MRKQEEFQKRIDERLDNMFNKFTEAIAGAPSPQKQTGNDLDSYTVEQLEAQQASVPEELQPQFTAYLNKRRVQDQVDARVNESLRMRDSETQRKAAAEDAIRRFPELRNESSQMARESEKILEKWGGKSYIDANPRALLDAANEAAITLGVKPSTTGFRPEPRGTGATRQNRAATPPADAGESVLSREENERIAARLGNALGRNKKFDLDAVDKSQRAYKESVHERVRG